jgi:N6-adenosine-specific RNA methylase IME4
MPDWPFGNLKLFGYDLVVVDCPWSPARAGHEFQARVPRRVMPYSEINRLPIGNLARRDCLLFSWATPQLLDLQIDALHRWGFTYVSKIEWVPNSVTNDNERPCRVRTSSECILVGVIGEPEHNTLPGFIQGGDRRYPRKPKPFYDMIDRYCPALTFRADIFTMKGNKSWDNWRPRFDDDVADVMESGPEGEGAGGPSLFETEPAV